MRVRKINLLLASGFLIICDVVFYFTVVQEITWLIVLVMALIYFGGMGTLVRQWNIKIKDIENKKIESVFRGKALVEITLPFQVRYMDSEGEYQSRVVEKKQRRKEKQGTMVDIIVENGEIVLVEKKLPE